MKKPAIIYGAGGHGMVVADVVRSDGRYELLGFIDDAPNLQGWQVAGLPVLGGRSTLISEYGHALVIIGIGENSIRRKVARMLSEAGFTFLTAIHCSASVSPYASLGEGVVVMPQAVVNAAARVEAQVILNTGCIVEHDCQIGHATHISIGAVIAGKVVIGDEVMVGANATVLPKIRIGAYSVIGAGAVVTSHLPDSVVAIGLPARVSRRRMSEDRFAP